MLIFPIKRNAGLLAVYSFRVRYIKTNTNITNAKVWFCVCVALTSFTRTEYLFIYNFIGIVFRKDIVFWTKKATCMIVYYNETKQRNEKRHLYVERCVIFSFIFIMADTVLIPKNK